MKIRLHGTEDEFRQTFELLESVLMIQSVSEPCPATGAACAGACSKEIKDGVIGRSAKTLYLPGTPPVSCAATVTGNLSTSRRRR